MSTSIRLEASSWTLESLLARVRAGEVRVPEFQRNFQWSRSDVEKLVDSVHRSYPIGTLLLWKRRGPAERLTLGDITFDVPSSDGVLWVVDGQQRLTSLANVLLSDKPSARFDVAFEAAAGRLTRAGERTLPLSVALDSERLLEWLTQNALGNDARRAAIRLGTALREYRIPAWIIETEREEDIREIFGRLNSLGKKLKPDEIFEALERTPAKSLSTTAQRISRLGFGAVGNKLIHQTIRAFQGEDFTRDRVGRLKDSSVFDAVEQGLANAIVLVREAGIPHLKLLPYNFALVLLGAFFARHPQPLARNRELLQRWLWRGAVSGQQSGKDLAWLRTHINALALPESEAVQAMLRATVRQLPQTWDVMEKRFDLRSARSRLEALALLALVEPRLHVDAIAKALDGTFFMEALPGRRMMRLLRGKGFAPGAMHGLESVANRVVLVGGNLQSTPGLDGVAGGLRPAATVEDLPTVGARARYFSEWMPVFLETHARTLEDDRGPLDALKLEDEVVDAA